MAARGFFSLGLSCVVVTGGHESPRWAGQCPGCGEWNTLVEEVKAPAAVKPTRRAAKAVKPVALREVDAVADIYSERSSRKPRKRCIPVRPDF